jgi:ParB-like chromosome segregation protein Spo0J
LANPKNWRRHPGHQQAALSGVLNELGWIQRVIVNQRTGYLVDGHARVTVAMRAGQDRIPVLYVDLSEEEEALALATLDPISALATADVQALRDVLDEVKTGDAAVMSMLSDLAEREGVLESLADRAAGAEVDYTAKIDTPVYEPTGECPDIRSLVDRSRYESLLSQIEEADVDRGVKDFLRLAATRHLVFDYRRVAEFYAHADSSVQHLFEDSALVIIDFDRAIQLGYVHLGEEMKDILEEALDD